ncbi:MAG: hypothetical protein IJA69_03235 [Clostridia bacterium]|nr:hypothetical protein [Clostridia bacterium]
MSILTGYPVGCKLVADLYYCGDLTKNQAKKSLCFCSNSGPMFILGSVGISMLFSKSSGYILLISHILGALINGLFYRNLKPKDDKPYEISQKQNNTENIISSSVLDSITSILLVGGMIVLCFICITIIQNINLFSPICSFFEIFNIDKSITNSILSGIFEITKGCLDVSNLSISSDIKTIICSFLISFGGFSTIMQAMAFVKDITSYKFMILQKTTHAIFSCAVCCLILLLI